MKIQTKAVNENGPNSLIKMGTGMSLGIFTFLCFVLQQEVTVEWYKVNVQLKKTCETCNKSSLTAGLELHSGILGLRWGVFGCAYNLER